MDSKLMKAPLFLFPLLFATVAYAGEPVGTMVPGPYSAQTAEERAQVSQDALDQANAPAPDARQQYQDHLTETGAEAHKNPVAQAVAERAEPPKEGVMAAKAAPAPQHPPCANAEACLVQVLVEKWFAAEVAAAKTEALQRVPLAAPVVGETPLGDQK